MGSSMEDIIQALLEFLVDPLLPSNASSSKEVLCPDKEELVAKQVHAVVLLYNYYHRKGHPEQEFLEFESFCKIVVALKPSLLPYMKFMQRGDSKEVNDLDKQLSLTEKAIMKSCGICKSLDASNDNPVIEGWPITKVAVFLVDSEKENCCLLHSSITQGVWSLIEKYVNDVHKGSEKHISNEASLQLLAWSAVKEACGINRDELKTLERHVVYSISKEKAAVRLFVMQCTQTKQELNLIPINDAIESLQGPVVINESGCWTTTPVVEYFHMLPFSDKVSDWFSRKGLSSTSQDLDLAIENENYDIAYEIESLPNTSSYFKSGEEVDNYDSSLLNLKPRKNTSNRRETVREVENGSTVHLKPEPLTSSSLREAVKEKYCKNPNREMEPQPTTSSLLETAEEVENHNSSLLREENLTAQHSAVGTEVRDGYSNHSNKETLQHFAQHSEEAKEVRYTDSPSRKVECTPTVVHKKRKRYENCNSKNSDCITRTPSAEFLRLEDERFAVPGSSACIDESPLACSYVDRKSKISAAGTDQTALTRGAIIEADVIDSSLISHYESFKEVLSDEKFSDAAMSNQGEMQDHALVSFNFNVEHLHKLQLTIASKQDLLSQTALMVLSRKRDILSQQHRSIEDELAWCDKKIHTILDGGGDALAVELDCIVEGCHDPLLRGVTTAKNEGNLHSQDKNLSLVLKRKLLCEANLFVHCPCQELDSICNENTWTLPTYHLSTSEGGFQAKVMVKGVDFECSSMGVLSDNPGEARNSAAWKMLVKLRTMAAEKTV